MFEVAQEKISTATQIYLGSLFIQILDKLDLYDEYFFTMLQFIFAL